MSSVKDEEHRRSVAEPAGVVCRYAAPIATFLTALPAHVVGHLAANSDFDVRVDQRDAWLSQIDLLARALPGIEGAILLEFNIPRMGRRIDAVLLVGPIVFAIEFKIGEDSFRRAAQEQVWDYALDLKNFHEASHPAAVVPILVATEAVTTKRSCCMPTPMACIVRSPSAAITSRGESRARLMSSRPEFRTGWLGLLCPFAWPACPTVDDVGCRVQIPPLPAVRPRGKRRSSSASNSSVGRSRSRG